ncbi:MAG: CRISPR-associated endonuclease Cas3'', partial [Peptococcales bacterium]
MYYAKPVQGYKGSYEYHVKRCIEIFYFEFEGKKTSLRRILERIGWELEQFKLDMYIAVAMHDFGKLSEVFQEQMQCKIDSRKPKNYFRHELLSTAYTILVNQDGRKNWEREFPFVYYIILSHHKRLNPLLSDFNREFNNDVWP